jgi:hypothetical protein
MHKNERAYTCTHACDQAEAAKLSKQLDNANKERAQATQQCAKWAGISIFCIFCHDFRVNVVLTNLGVRLKLCPYVVYIRVYDAKWESISLSKPYFWYILSWNFTTEKPWFIYEIFWEECALASFYRNLIVDTFCHESSLRKSVYIDWRMPLTFSWCLWLFHNVFMNLFFIVISSGHAYI